MVLVLRHDGNRKHQLLSCCHLPSVTPPLLNVLQFYSGGMDADWLNFRGGRNLRVLFFTPVWKLFGSWSAFQRNAFQWKQNHLTLWYEVQELFSQKETDLKVYPRGVLFKNTLQLSSQSSVRPGLSGFSRCDNKEVKRLPQTSPVLEWFHRWEGGGEQSTEELEAGTTFFSNNHIAVLKPLVGFFILTKPIIKST